MVNVMKSKKQKQENNSPSTSPFRQKGQSAFFNEQAKIADKEPATDAGLKKSENSDKEPDRKEDKPVMQAQNELIAEKEKNKANAATL